MNKELENRSNNTCELCDSNKGIQAYDIKELSGANRLVVCADCKEALEKQEKISGNQWRKLEESVWSEYPAVQTAAYRLLSLSDDTWAQESLDMVYVDEALKEAALKPLSSATHFDSNNQALQNGDSVTVIKDLDVKGSSFTVKRGTVARNIRLVHDDPSHVLAKVEGQSIYLKTEFLKK